MWSWVPEGNSQSAPLNRMQLRSPKIERQWSKMGGISILRGIRVLRQKNNFSRIAWVDLLEFLLWFLVFCGSVWPGFLRDLTRQCPSVIATTWAWDTHIQLGSPNNLHYHLVVMALRIHVWLPSCTHLLPFFSRIHLVVSQNLRIPGLAVYKILLIRCEAFLSLLDENVYIRQASF